MNERFQRGGWMDVSVAGLVLPTLCIDTSE
jgi:hypothetical protein